jgi:hypothetical protein
VTAFLMAERLKLLVAVRDTAGKGTFSILISDALNLNSIGEFVWNRCSSTLSLMPPERAFVVPEI